MAIFSRLSDLVKSNINDLIDKAEDPEKMCKQIIIDMEAQLAKATQALGQAMGSERQVQKQLTVAKEQSANWNDKAKMALTAGNEELAKQALAQKVTQDNLVNQYQEMANSMSTQVLTVRQQVDGLKAKLEEARSKQAMLVARAQMADVKKDMSKSLGGMDSSSAFAKMEKMEQKVMQKEAEADAFSDLSAGDTSTDDAFKQLEQDSSVDAEMARLRAELGQ